MPREIAALGCILFIFYLFRVDSKAKDARHSWALWIPQIWLLLVSSRYLSQWFGLAQPVKVSLITEGSFLDRNVFLALVIVGVITLLRRRPKMGQWVAQHPWICLYFLFGALSISWSDFPVVSFKRWIKSLGNLIMVLVVLTEKEPYEAVGRLLRRLGFLLIPLSILFIKYYRELGVTYNRWTDETTYLGVTTQKNSLGILCMVCGLYFLWDLLYKRSEPFKLRLDFLFLGMIAWLLYKADSVTSLVCLLLAAALLGIGRTAFVARGHQRILASLVIGAFLFVVADSVFGVSDIIISSLGRDPTLTTRVPMWQELQKIAENILVGEGFEAFWLGNRLELLWGQYGVRQAHNGYLETYLNLGVIGLFLLIGMIISGFIKVGRALKEDYSVGILRMCLVSVVVLYNVAEAGFSSIGVAWMMFFFGATLLPNQSQSSIEPVWVARNSGTDQVDLGSRL
jgi:O-antigen ligase